MNKSFTLKNSFTLHDVSNILVLWMRPHFPLLFVLMKKGSGELPLANSQILKIADWLLMMLTDFKIAGAVILAFLKSITPISDPSLKSGDFPSSPEPFPPPQINTESSWFMHETIGNHRYSEDLPQGSIEIPCIFHYNFWMTASLSTS